MKKACWSCVALFFVASGCTSAEPEQSAGTGTTGATGTSDGSPAGSTGSSGGSLSTSSASSTASAGDPTSGSSGAGDESGASDESGVLPPTCDATGFAAEGVSLELGAALDEALFGSDPSRALIDMDGDGTLEAFIDGQVYSVGGGGIDWAGSNTFSIEEDFLIDFDGDGDIDRLNVVDNSLQRANGLELSAANGVGLPASFVHPTRIFALPENGRSASRMWLHNSSPLFPLLVDTWPDTGNAYAALVDLNGDGRPDLLTADGHAGNETGVWLVYENLGSTFDGTPVPWEVQGEFDGYGFATDQNNHTFAHLDGDGLIDLLCAGCASETGRVSMFLNTGSGFEAHGELPEPAGDGQTTVVSARYGRIDIDRDGDIDLLDLTGDVTADGGWFLWLNHDGVFQDPVLWSVPALADVPPPFTERAILDINGDGVHDLFRNTIPDPTVHLGCLGESG